MIIGFLLAAAVAGATPAETGPAQTPPAQAQVAATTQTNDLDKMVCKRITPTGTRLGGEKVCKTRREWLDITRQSRDALDSNVNRGLQENPPGG
ncbi:MAG: hypothetical protein ACXWKU_21530 [Caulobacteraceae bacterium]